VVVEGDYLLAIGERFSVSAGALKVHNKLASDTIEIGQQLAIPGATAETSARV
jgi:LysM repeat protein